MRLSRPLVQVQVRSRTTLRRTFYLASPLNGHCLDVYEIMIYEASNIFKQTNSLVFSIKENAMIVSDGKCVPWIV